MDTHTTLRSDCPLCGRDFNGKAVPCPHLAGETDDFEMLAALMEGNTSWPKY